MLGTAGNAAAPMAKCRNVRRGIFMMLPPRVRCSMSRTCNPAGALHGSLHLSPEEVEESTPGVFTCRKRRRLGEPGPVPTTSAVAPIIVSARRAAYGRLGG